MRWMELIQTMAATQVLIYITFLLLSAKRYLKANF